VCLRVDLLLFYVFLNSPSFRSFLLIGVWGGSDRQRAAKRFSFTLCGSFVTLVGLVWLVSIVIQRGSVASSTDLIEIAASLTPTRCRTWFKSDYF
jgi:NADH:ubiquinone oxidoreductase subunit 4 (subunit M)